MMASPRKEILYEGYYYDVTDFIQRHPGGEEILEYHTLPGEDATIPFQQFHQRNFKQVLGILKSFKRRPVPPAEKPLQFSNDPKSLRNKAMTQDFLQLFRELQEEGLFEPCYSHVAYRLVEPILLTLAAALVLTYWDHHHPLGILVASVLLGVMQVRCDFAMHEGGHHSLTGSPKVDRTIQSALFGISNGVSAVWWRWDHNQHHAMTNRIHHDNDIDLKPLVAINKVFLREGGNKPNFVMRHQKYLLWIHAVIGYFYWKLVQTPTTLAKHPDMADILFIGIHYILCFQFLSFPIYMWSTIFAAWYLWLNVSVGHSFLPMRDEPCHWVEAAIRHSTDVDHRPWCSWWMGYLNFQIEHHLFPTLPQLRLPLIADRVKALAAKHELPYREYPYWKVVWLAFQNVIEVEAVMRKM